VLTAANIIVAPANRLKTGDHSHTDELIPQSKAIPMDVTSRKI
jgi:hypothetical protein